jgi:deoxyribodipyrimidine photo-lyase
MKPGNEESVIFWFRRDLRLDDNAGLWNALKSGYKVLPVFIYDAFILEKLEKDDLRMGFLGEILAKMDDSLRKAGSGLYTVYDSPAEAFRKLAGSFSIKGLYFNRDYEPYAVKRDSEVTGYFKSLGIPVFDFRDQVIFEKQDIVKDDGKPYTVYTPYSRKWLKAFTPDMIEPFNSGKLVKNFTSATGNNILIPRNFGFKCPPVTVRQPLLDAVHIKEYHRNRDIPSKEGTSFLSPHLRFGTVSIREVLRRTLEVNEVFVRELIWREFFMQILHHFPRVTENSFRPEYDRISWLNNEEHFQKWCEGRTGFPLVDAGMRELSSTGYMHNRVRMLAANFLTRHLLTDWRWGEAWFAEKLLDFELSSNNGNWQWAAGSGCDAAPYFRIFNPDIQLKKFDPKMEYVRKWVPEINTEEYPHRCIDLTEVRGRAIKAYRDAVTS